MPRTGGQILIDQLLINGVERAFCVPGESYLAALDALYEARNRIELIVCRQEGGAAYMAEADGKMTGRPGICFATRGPGATNASVGVHVALQDSTPMILFVGDVAREQRDREAFQEVDFGKMFAPLAKWVVRIDEAARIPELVSQAFHRAMSGRPGPVVVVLPEDMLTETVDTADAGAATAVQAHPAPETMQRLRAMIEKSERPFMIVGGGTWNEQATKDIAAFAEAMDLPTGASFRCQSYFDNDHKLYAGDVGIGVNPKLAERIRDTDLLIAAGARLGEMTTSGYTLVTPPVPKQTLVHIHPGAEELGRVYQPTLAINSGMAEFCAAARALKPVDAAVVSGARRSWTESARAEYLAWTKEVQCVGPIQMAEVVRTIREATPPDTMICNGAGNFSAWFHVFHRYCFYRAQLAPTNGSMGYGVPAAVAAKLRYPERVVIAAAGDGDFLMNGQEFATAVQHGANIIVLVVNNGMYGTIRMHQERDYPGRVVGTDLRNPDFAAYARAFGGHGETVRTTAEFRPALERAMAAGKPAIIELPIDPEALTIRRTLSEIRGAR
ncbi:MAG: thiamine pyrophosphate-binding protein [Dongiaceae bacterium]